MERRLLPKDSCRVSAVGFGGLSIHMQIAADFRPFFALRVLEALAYRVFALRLDFEAQISGKQSRL